MALKSLWPICDLIQTMNQKSRLAISSKDLNLKQKMSLFALMKLIFLNLFDKLIWIRMGVNKRDKNLFHEIKLMPKFC